MLKCHLNNICGKTGGYCLIKKVSTKEKKSANEAPTVKLRGLRHIEFKMAAQPMENTNTKSVLRIKSFYQGFT